MSLTPKDVHEKKFTTVRLREGYDITEVDHFLDEVETELTRLLGEGDLQSTRAGAAPKQPAADTSPVQEPVAQVPVDNSGSPVSITTAEASSRAARLLEIAAANADQLVGEAREEADKLVTEAKTLAERLESDARTRSDKLDAETSERRHQLFGELEQEREALSRSIDDLHLLEQDLRARLRSFFEAQLQILDGNSEAQLTAALLAEPATPARLREIFGEDGNGSSAPEHDR